MNRSTTRAALPTRPTRVQRIGRAIISLGHAERYARRRLVWNRVYRAVSYAKSALWIVPLVAIVLVLALAPLLRALDARLGWHPAPGWTLSLIGRNLAGADHAEFGPPDTRSVFARTWLLSLEARL